MWNVKVLINGYLIIKYNLSMYIEIFKGKLVYS